MGRRVVHPLASLVEYKPPPLSLPRPPRSPAKPVGRPLRVIGSSDAIRFPMPARLLTDTPRPCDIDKPAGGHERVQVLVRLPLWSGRRGFGGRTSQHPPAVQREPRVRNGIETMHITGSFMASTSGTEALGFALDTHGTPQRAKLGHSGMGPRDRRPEQSHVLSNHQSL